MELNDRVVVITGGGSGIGEALAHAAHDAGARHVVVADLHGGHALAHLGDGVAMTREKMAGVEAKKAQAQATMAKVGLDQQKMFADIQNQQQEGYIKAATAKSQMAAQQAGANKMNMEARMRPYEMQNEQNKQGMDFQLKREQIRKTPVGRE